MLSKHTILAVLALFLVTTTNAQSIGIGGSINYASNGVNVFYSKLSKSKNWTYDAGIRVMVNTYSINANEQNYAYYQTGYANNLWEHFSLNFRVSRKLFRWRFVELDAMSNLHLTCHSILEKQNYTDSNNTIVRTEEVYWKPSPAIELTIGLLLQVKISPKLSLFAGSGLGYIYFNHSYEGGWNRTTNTPTQLLRDGLKPNKSRGAHEYVGLDGLPMLTAGVKYSLK